MNKIIANRYQHEYDILKTTIDIVEEENVALKTKLALLVQSNKLLPSRLLKAELLLSKLVKLDDTIRKYKKELKQHLIQCQQSWDHEIPSKSILLQEEKLQVGLDRIKEMFLEIKLNLEKFVELP
ncbi:MAG: hypothetical protein SH818_01555 [Saprospiraceae bacterium]|nr:hypothetical protein [Saprospiraceae bacterium]